MMNLRECNIRYEKTVHGWHIIIAVIGDLSPGCILLAQAIICGFIGGDLKRECFNFRRARNKVFLNVLFEPETV